MPVIFLRDMYTKVLSIGDADREQSKLFKELSGNSKDEKLIEKQPFTENVRLLFDTREKVDNNFRSNAFPLIRFNT